MPLTDQNIIFITGASRSGTTLLSIILRKNSNIFGLKELHYFGDTWDPHKPNIKMTERQMVAAVSNIYKCQAEGVLAPKNKGIYHKRAEKLINSLDSNDRDPANLFMAAVLELCKAEGKSIPCEQTPRNIFYADKLLQLFPNAKLVHVIRDPRAVMASQKFRWRRRSLATIKTGVSHYQSLRVWINYHPYTAARMWLKATQQALRMENHPRFTTIRFEDLLREPEKTVQNLCKEFDLQFDPNMLDVGQINSSHQSSVGGARKGLHTDAIDKWQRILAPGEISVANRLCHSLMDVHGYKQLRQMDERSNNEFRYRLTYLFHLFGVLIVNPRRAWVQARALFGQRHKSKQAIKQGVKDTDGSKSNATRKA